MQHGNMVELMPPDKNEQATAGDTGDKPPRLTKKKAWSKPTISIIEDGLLKTESGALSTTAREDFQYFIPS